MITTLLAASIALILFKGINPANISSIQVVEWDQFISTTKSPISPSFQILFPSNIVKAFLENNVIGIVFIAFLFGIGAQKTPS